jgi:membrane-bound ClpP family serine protease
MRTRLVIAIITSLLDEAVIIALILWVLPKLGVFIPLYGTILIAVAFAVYAVLLYRVGSRSIRRKPLLGLTDMVGVEGRVASPLAPEGFVKIIGELWDSRAEGDAIGIGVDVIVTHQDGLKLIVRRKNS